jgi:hypothetical protein
LIWPSTDEQSISGTYPVFGYTVPVISYGYYGNTPTATMGPASENVSHRELMRRLRQALNEMYMSPSSLVRYKPRWRPPRETLVEHRSFQAAPRRPCYRRP